MSSGQKLSAQQVARAFRALAEEHLDEHGDDGAAAWRKLAVGSTGPLSLVPRPSGRFPKAVWIALPVAAALALAIWVWPAERISYEVRGGTASVGHSTLGELVATEESAAAIVFSEESRIDVGPHTTVRVQVEAKNRVVARLSQGELQVHVIHRPETDYRFWAGPYEVQVIGTVFRLTFEPTDERLRVDLHEGRVRVYDRERHEVIVASGQTASFAKGRPVEAERSVGTAVAPESAAAGEPAEGSAEAASTLGRVIPGSGTESPSFTALAGAGRFGDIVRLAEQLGIDRVLRDRGGADLQELAQAALYTGNTPLAERTWKVLRSRFSGQSVGVNATFFLARVSDQTGRRREALALFQSYLKEAPHGTYAAEALGRELLLAQALGDAALSRAVATEYVSRFPRGPYVANARQLLRGE